MQAHRRSPRRQSGTWLTRRCASRRASSGRAAKGARCCSGSSLKRIVAIHLVTRGSASCVHLHFWGADSYTGAATGPGTSRPRHWDGTRRFKLDSATVMSASGLPHPSLVGMPILSAPSRCALLGAQPDLGNGGTTQLLMTDHETGGDSVSVCRETVARPRLR